MKVITKTTVSKPNPATVATGSFESLMKKKSCLESTHALCEICFVWLHLVKPKPPLLTPAYLYNISHLAITSRFLFFFSNVGRPEMDFFV